MACLVHAAARQHHLHRGKARRTNRFTTRLRRRFWNTVNGTALNCIDTGSQVCNLVWSKNVNEIVSTHGYSQNQVVVWKYPSLTKLVSVGAWVSRTVIHTSMGRSQQHA